MSSIAGGGCPEPAWLAILERGTSCKMQLGCSSMSLDMGRTLQTMPAVPPEWFWHDVGARHLTALLLWIGRFAADCLLAPKNSSFMKRWAELMLELICLASQTARQYLQKIMQQMWHKPPTAALFSACVNASTACFWLYPRVCARAQDSHAAHARRIV